jgi:hypothetical protein
VGYSDSLSGEDITALSECQQLREMLKQLNPNTQELCDIVSSKIGRKVRLPITRLRAIMGHSEEAGEYRNTPYSSSASNTINWLFS